MYAPKHFAPHEILPGLSGEETWESLDPTLRQDLDDRLLETADQIWELLHKHGCRSIKINDYVWGGERSSCGFRGPDCTIGALHSQHRKGKAADGHCDGLTSEQARDIIRQAVTRGELPFLGGIELDVSWLHFDVRDRVDGNVVEFHA